MAMNLREAGQTSLIIGVATVVTMEYTFILKTWRKPFYGYRFLLSTIFAVGLLSEIEREFGDGFLGEMPRAVVLAITANFAVFEVAMYFKRKAQERSRRVFVENALVEDFCLAGSVV